MIETKEMIIIVQKVETDRAKLRKINQNYVCVLILQGQNTVNRYNWQTGTNKKNVCSLHLSVYHCIFTRAPFVFELKHTLD